MSSAHDDQGGPPTSASSAGGHRFDLGKVVATPAALALLEKQAVNPLLLLGRHLTGDWGDLCYDDQMSNDAALVDGGRIFSSYQIAPVEESESVGANVATIWIITEAIDEDRLRNSTCILTPECY